VINDRTQWKPGYKIDRINFTDLVDVEVYSPKNKVEKQRAINIIINNDFLQYHYFAQQSDIVRSASFIFLLYIRIRGIKTYIGFSSVNSGTISKLLRRRYFGNHFYRSLFLKKLKAFTLTRIVLLPSYRGLGLGSYFIDNIVNHMKDKCQFFEIYSNMLHTFNFAGNELDSTFVSMRNELTPDEYKTYFGGLGKNTDFGGMKGFKGSSKFIANMAFWYNKNDEMIQLILERTGLMIDYDVEYELTSEKIMYGLEHIIPLIILKHFDFDYIKNLHENKKITDATMKGGELSYAICD